MAQSSIEWTDRTENPIYTLDESGKRGWHCVHVSEGCRNCYAERVNHRFGTQTPYAANVKPNLHLDEELLKRVIRSRKPCKRFWGSMTDLFADWGPDKWLDKIFAACAATDRDSVHQFLTKREARMLAYFSDPDRLSKIIEAGRSMGHTFRTDQWPLPHVWLGVSVEDQKTADERIPLLLQTPAAVRFVSYEPALGPVDFTNVNQMEAMWQYMNPADRLKNFNNPNYPKVCRLDSLRGHSAHSIEQHPKLDWIIAGGESGPQARPAHPDWFRSVRDQCQAAGVPFFFKQWGEWAPFKSSEIEELIASNPGLPMSTPTCLIKQEGRVIRPYCMNDAPGNEMVKVGKKRAGRMLDGREWNEFPVSIR